MADYLAGKAIRKLVYGLKVDRATATLPQTTASALFNIVGGRVSITGIIGEVTTVIQTQANNTKLTANPTVATSASVDICTVLNITADAVGDLYGITGTFATALVGAGGAATMCATPVTVQVGTIDLSCAASNTGSIKWTIFYIPIDDGAYITAA